MTTYGTIPTSATAGSTATSYPFGFISRAKERARSALVTRRPWRELTDLHALGLPASLGEAYLRIRANSARFLMNYAIIVLLVIFLGLIWHPVSLIVFVASMAAWLFLYFLRDEPLVVFGRTIGERAVLIGLSVVTLALLLLTKATANILISLAIGAVIVLAHAALRRTEDAFGEDDDGRCYTPVGSAPAAVLSSTV